MITQKFNVKFTGDCSSAKKPQHFSDDGSQLPAFKVLMQKHSRLIKISSGQRQERYALQAQRLAPQAAETYLFLCTTANHKQQYF